MNALASLHKVHAEDSVPPHPLHSRMRLILSSIKTMLCKLDIRTLLNSTQLNSSLINNFAAKVAE